MPHSPIAAYLDALSHELAFDPALSGRVLHEVRDHLWEAAEAEADAAAAEEDEPALAAERRAVSRLGDPGELAAQYRAISLYTRMRRTGALAILAVAGAFFAMQGRSSWYGLVQWTASERLRAIGEIALPLDRAAFLAAAILGIAGWLYSASRSIPRTYRPGCRDQLRRCGYLSGAAIVAVAVAAVTELVLLGVRLTDAVTWSAVLLPAGSMAVEIALVVGVALYLRDSRRRIALCPTDR